MHATLRPCRIAFSALSAFAALVLPAAPQTVLVLGDSLSEEYAFELPFSAPYDSPLEANIANWVEILAAARADEISFGKYESQLASYADYRDAGYAFNWAVPGFKTTDLIELLNPPVFPGSAEQLLDAASFPKLKAQLVNGDVSWAVVFCSGNDLTALYSALATGTATDAQLAAIRDNLAATVDFVRTQNAAVKIVLVNAPDVGVTPAVKSVVPDAAFRAVASARIGDLNTLLADLASDRGIAYADIFTITRSLDGTSDFLIGGIPFYKVGDSQNRPQFLFARDGFHASTAAQALIANAILGAMNSRYEAGFTLLADTEILVDVLGLESGPPVITSQTQSAVAVSGQPVSLSIETARASNYQWFKGGRRLSGAQSPTLDLASVGPAEAGLYDCAAMGSGVTTLSTPVVVGVLPPAGQRTAGDVATQEAWQNIHHPNGHTYDQFLLSGPAGTFTADPGEIARMSFLAPGNNIVQVEMSGAGAITVVLDPTTVAGPMAPSLYNQSGVEYMKGLATIILAGADETTHFTIYSVGTMNNPGVTLPDVHYPGWANVAASGIVSTDGKLGGIHQGNAAYYAGLGPIGLCAPTVGEVGGQVVIHEVIAAESAQPYLLFAPGGTVSVKIAGSDLLQTNEEPITVSGLAEIEMGAGQDSCGRYAPTATLAAALVTPDGTDVTDTLVGGP